MDNETDSLELGGNIVLTGFKGIDAGSMIIVKKIVGNYVKKITSLVEDFQGIKLTLKKASNANKFELKGQLLAAGKTFNSETFEHNLFIGLNSVLQKIETEIRK